MNISVNSNHQDLKTIPFFNNRFVASAVLWVCRRLLTSSAVALSSALILG